MISATWDWDCACAETTGATIVMMSAAHASPRMRAMNIVVPQKSHHQPGGDGLVKFDTAIFRGRSS